MEKDIFEQLEILRPLEQPILMKLIDDGITCGFTSPALDHIENDIDLVQIFIKNKSATFLVKIKGTSMIEAGFEPGGIMFVDRSVEPQDGKFAVCFLDGVFTVKRLKVSKKEKKVWLVPENNEMKPILVTEENESFLVWGIVTWICKPV